MKISDSDASNCSSGRIGKNKDKQTVQVDVCDNNDLYCYAIIFSNMLHRVFVLPLFTLLIVFIFFM